MTKSKIVHKIHKKFEQYENKKRSMQHYVVQIFEIITVFLLILLIVSSIFLYNAVYNQTYDYMKSVLKIYDNQISQGLDDVSNYLIDLSLNNAEVSGLSVSKDKTNSYKLVNKIKQTLSSGVYSFPYIDGMFVYSATQDIYINQLNNIYTNINSSETDYKCSNLLNKMLSDKDDLVLSEWFVVKILSDNYFVRIFKTNNVYTGSWVRMDHVAAYFKYFTEMDSEFLFVDESGNIVQKQSSVFDSITVSSTDKPEFYNIAGKRFLAVACDFSFCDYSILAMVPISNMFDIISPVYYTLLVITVFSIALLISTTLFVSNIYFKAPLNLLRPVIKSMKIGEFDQKIVSNSKFIEIDEITNVFNEMIDEIKKLRINVYEENIKKQDIELQYLKSQLAPHFLINCLNTIFALSDSEENTPLIHEIIKTLSDHLRYTLSTRTSVSLNEEMHYVENYLILTQLRFPESLSYSLTISKKAEDASVFPMIVLLVIENSIKNNVVMGELLNISLNAYVEEDRLHITCIDSGSGFNEDEIEIYNHINEHSEVLLDGHHIGINNIYSRLKLISGESASIKLSNELGSGARIDVDMPYKKYEDNIRKELQ